MNFMQKWIYRPTYIALKIISIVALAAIIACGLETIYAGEGWNYFIKTYKDLFFIQAYCYMSSYYIKWQYVYGPPKKEQPNATTNG